MKYTTPTPPTSPAPNPPSPHPADPRHWTPPLSLTGVDNPSSIRIGPESRHLMQSDGLSAPRCSAKMLQAAETLNQNPGAEGG